MSDTRRSFRSLTAEAVENEWSPLAGDCLWIRAAGDKVFNNRAIAWRRKWPARLRILDDGDFVAEHERWQTWPTGAESGALRGRLEKQSGAMVGFTPAAMDKSAGAPGNDLAKSASAARK